MKCTGTLTFVFSYSPAPSLMTSGLCSLPQVLDHPSHVCLHSWGGVACRMDLRPPGNNHRACSSALPAQNPTPHPAWAWGAGKGGPGLVDGHSTTWGLPGVKMGGFPGHGLQRLAQRITTEPQAGVWGAGWGTWGPVQRGKAEPCLAHFLPPPVTLRGGPQEGLCLAVGVSLQPGDSECFDVHV